MKVSSRDAAFLLLGTGEQVEWPVCPVLHINPLIPMDIFLPCTCVWLKFPVFPINHCMGTNSIILVDNSMQCMCVTVRFPVFSVDQCVDITPLIPVDIITPYMCSDEASSLLSIDGVSCFSVVIYLCLARESPVKSWLPLIHPIPIRDSLCGSLTVRLFLSPLCHCH